MEGDRLTATRKTAIDVKIHNLPSLLSASQLPRGDRSIFENSLLETLNLMAKLPPALQMTGENKKTVLYRIHDSAGRDTESHKKFNFDPRGPAEKDMNFHLVAMVDGKIVGSFSFEVLAPRVVGRYSETVNQWPGILHAHHLIVQEDMREQDIARQLVTYALTSVAEYAGENEFKVSKLFGAIPQVNELADGVISALNSLFQPVIPLAEQASNKILYFAKPVNANGSERRKLIPIVGSIQHTSIMPPTGQTEAYGYIGTESTAYVLRTVHDAQMKLPQANSEGLVAIQTDVLASLCYPQVWNDSVHTFSLAFEPDLPQHKPS